MTRSGTDQPIKTRYLGHTTGYQPIRERHFLIWSVPGLEIIYRREYTEQAGRAAKHTLSSQSLGEVLVNYSIN